MKKIFILTVLTTVFCAAHAYPFLTGEKMQFISENAVEICETPTNVQVTNILNTSARINWEHDCEECESCSYQIWYRTPGDITWYRRSTSNLSIKLLFLAPATTYEYKIRARCSFMDEPFSSPFTGLQTFTTDLMRSSGQPDENGTSLEVYPNPNSGDFDVALNAFNGGTTIEVYDLGGRLIYHEALIVDEKNISTRMVLNGFTGTAYLIVHDNYRREGKLISVSR